MRILLCNKFYYRRGGDCIYTLGLEKLLKERGHDVAVFSMRHPDNADTAWSRFFPSEVNMNSIAGKAGFLSRSLGDRETCHKFSALLDEFRPDVVHLNNIHSQLSPVIARIAHTRAIRVVWTLHDYKLLCPRYDCLKNGNQPCEACFTDKKQVLLNRCMKNSLPASVLAYLEALKWNRRVLDDCTDVFICPSRFMRDKMLQGGFPERKLVYLPNFVDTESCRRPDYGDRRDYYCYVGRLSYEKGIGTMLEAAQSLPWRLVVAGDGPLKDRLNGATHIEYVGKLDWTGVKDLVGGARFSVIPSEWYENSPLSVIESLCLGTPVLGADMGGIPELVSPGTGLIFRSGDSAGLASGISDMFSREFDYSRIAAGSQARFDADAYLGKLQRIYAGFCK